MSGKCGRSLRDILQRQKSSQSINDTSYHGIAGAHCIPDANLRWSCNDRLLTKTAPSSPMEMTANCRTNTEVISGKLQMVGVTVREPFKVSLPSRPSLPVSAVKRMCNAG
jgi:hypothetical protein